MAASSDRFLLACVMGWPIAHSRSPLLHNYWFARYGLAGTYVPIAMRPEGLAAAFRALHPLGFAGCNLTIPLKQHAMAIVDEVDGDGSLHRRDQLRDGRPGRVAWRNQQRLVRLRPEPEAAAPGLAGERRPRSPCSGRAAAREQSATGSCTRARGDPPRQPHAGPRQAIADELGGPITPPAVG
jgi:hypothetical protein